jgi:WD40 repeat protein
VRARVQDGTCTKEFRGHRSGVLGMAVHMGYMYTASSDCTIRVWSLAVRFAAAATTTFRAGIRHIGAGTRHIGAGTRHIGAGIRPTSAPGLALCPWRGLHTCVAARLDAEGCCAARRMGSAVTYCPATSALCSMSPHSRPIPACPLARLPRLLTSATLLRRRCRPAAQPEHAREFRARPGRCHARCLVIGSEKGADRSKAELYSASADSMVRSWNVSSSDQVAHGLYAWHPSEPTLER